MLQIVGDLGYVSCSTGAISSPRVLARCGRTSVARISGTTRRVRVRATQFEARSTTLSPQEKRKREELDSRFLVRDAKKDELYTVADIRCESFYMHPHDQYFYPIRQREIYSALLDRLEGGSRCLVVVDLQPPEEWKPFSSTDGSMVVASLDLTLHHAASGKRVQFEDGKLPWPDGTQDGVADGTAIFETKRFYISSMAVRGEWRRKKIAKALLRRVDEIAAKLHVREVFLHVDWDNKPAVELYRKQGFEKLIEHERRGRIPAWLSFLGKKEHTLLRKDLSAS